MPALDATAAVLAASCAKVSHYRCNSALPIPHFLLLPLEVREWNWRNNFSKMFTTPARQA